MTEYDKDNIIMNVLHTVGFPISRPAELLLSTYNQYVKSSQKNTTLTAEREQ